MFDCTIATAITGNWAASHSNVITYFFSVIFSSSLTNMSADASLLHTRFNLSTAALQAVMHGGFSPSLILGLPQNILMKHGQNSQSIRSSNDTRTEFLVILGYFVIRMRLISFPILSDSFSINASIWLTASTPPLPHMLSMPSAPLLNTTPTKRGLTSSDSSRKHTSFSFALSLSWCTRFWIRSWIKAFQ